MIVTTNPVYRPHCANASGEDQSTSEVPPQLACINPIGRGGCKFADNALP